MSPTRRHIAALAVIAIALVVGRAAHERGTVRAAAGASMAPQVVPGLFPAGRCRHPDSSLCDQPRFTTFELHIPLERDWAAGGNVGVYEGFVDGARVIAGDLLRYRWPAMQARDPAGANFVTAHTASGRALAVLPRGLASAPEGVIVRAEAPLSAGDCVIVVFGDRSRGSPGYQIPDLAISSDLLIEEDAAGNGRYTISPHVPPRLRVSGSQVESFDVIAPATPPGDAAGTLVRLTVRAIEGGTGPLDNRWLVQSFAGRVVFRSTDPRATLPPPLQFYARDRGVRVVEATLRSPGIQRITVEVEGNPEVFGTSNPIVIARPRAPRLFFGQLHNHSAVGGHSTQTTRFALAFASRASGLDFVAVSEHCRERTFDWSRLLELADRYDEPGRFVTFPAYEWTNATDGHRHVVFRDTATACSFCEVSGGDRSCAVAGSLDFLEQRVRGLPALLIVHHPAWHLDGFTWGSSLDDANQRLVEIYSWHGASEYFDNPLVFHGRSSAQWPAAAGTFVRDAIAQGYRFGIVADADNHLAMPGTSTGADLGDGVRYSWNGLMAVAAADLSRGSIFDGLWARRTYGTTGARILLDVRVGHAAMGEETTTNGPPTIRVRAVTVQPIQDVTVLRDGTEEIAHLTGGLDHIDASVVDVAAAPGQTHAYTVRLQQTDGQLAWSSPIWVTIP